MLNIISHEIRTPLTGVVGFYEVLKESLDNLPENQSEFVETFSGLGLSIERCRELVERLTRASRVMAGELRADDEAIEYANLGSVLSSTAEEMKNHAAGRNIDISYPKGISVKLICPSDAVKLILEEALSNAIKYSPDGETITITVDRENGGAKIVVRDKGPGISKEYIEDVVEPFFEIQDADFHSTSRYARGGGGLGLGLTLIMNILKGYHGMLTIDSPEGGGTALIMTLPVP